MIDTDLTVTGSEVPRKILYFPHTSKPHSDSRSLDPQVDWTRDKSISWGERRSETVLEKSKELGVKVRFETTSFQSFGRWLGSLPFFFVSGKRDLPFSLPLLKSVFYILTIKFFNRTMNT